MNFRKICLLTFCIPAAAFIGMAESMPSVFSWVHWQDGKAVVESQLPSIKATLYNPIEDAEIRDAASLKRLGWNDSGGGFLVTPHQAGGGRLTVKITGLPLGDQHVYLRFFGRLRKPGESWWFLTWMALGDGVGSGERRDVPAGTPMYQSGPAENIKIIGGTGGFDENTVYEVYLGQVENSGSVALWFERYEWTQMSKIGSIRIETAPDYNLSAALEENDFNAAIQRKFHPAGDDFSYGVVSGALKIRPKRLDELNATPLTDAIDLDGARNEWESAQIVILADKKPIENLTWEVSALTNSSGEKLSASTTIHPVGFTRLEHFDLNLNGWWPDPIMTGMDSITIPRGDVQPLWLRCRIAKDATPGIYQGTVTLRTGRHDSVEIPIFVRVRNFEQPDLSGLRVVMGCNDGSGGFETDYKINPSTIYGWESVWEEKLADWARRGVSAINLDYIWAQQLDQTTKMPTPEQLDQWITTLKQRLALAEQYGLRDKCYLYVFDEATAEWVPAMKKITAAIKKAIPDLPIMTTAHFPWQGPDTIDTIDWWCPQINHYDVDLADRARAAGKEVWMYVCNNPEKPFPNIRATANTAMDHRVMLGFMAKAMRYDGFLYYSTKASWSDAPMSADHVYTSWLIKNDGDGQLYQYDANGPLPSLRLENMRDGLEDYDMLTTAAALAQQQSLSAEAREILSQIEPYFSCGNGIVNSQVDFTQSPDELETVRRKVMDFIEAAK